MTVVDLILPIVAVIVTGLLAGQFNYLSRDLADGLIHFAYNIALPALLFGTLAQEHLDSLLAWRFLIAFGGGSLICFGLVFLLGPVMGKPAFQSRTMYGLSASMTNTAFVALPILHRLYGPHGVLPAAIATMFVALVMFPLATILLEWQGNQARSHPLQLARHVVLNPLVLSTLLGIAWAVTGLPLPLPVAAFLRIFGDTLTGCALFAIGLGMSLDGVRANLRASLVLSVVKLIVMPAIVLGLGLLLGLGGFYLTAAVICAAVPTAKTVYILSSEHRCEVPLVASAISLTTLLCVISLVAWLYALPDFG